jgi:hypothetical protein
MGRQGRKGLYFLYSIGLVFIRRSSLEESKTIDSPMFLNCSRWYIITSIFILLVCSTGGVSVWFLRNGNSTCPENQSLLYSTSLLNIILLPILMIASQVISLIYRSSLDRGPLLYLSLSCPFMILFLLYIINYLFAFLHGFKFLSECWKTQFGLEEALSLATYSYFVIMIIIMVCGLIEQMITRNFSTK